MKQTKKKNEGSPGPGVALIVAAKVCILTFLFLIFLSIHVDCLQLMWNYVQPQIRKSWDSMENANKKRK